MRRDLNGFPVGGLKAETMEQQPHHSVQGSLCNAMSSPLENKSIRRYLAPVGPDNRDFHITTLVDLKTQQSEQDVFRVVIDVIVGARRSCALRK